MNNKGQKYWKPLGLSAMLVGLLALSYVVLVFIKDYNEPLIGLFAFMIGVPALGPLYLGYHMSKGSVKAALCLRITIGLLLLIGVILDLFMGLDVLSFPPLAIPLILACVIWLILSFV